MDTVYKDIDRRAHALLRRFFGYDSFRPGQLDIIRSIMSGRDTLALMPTGGGKSICYQIPAMLHEGCCIVVSPLISLMTDQVAGLNANGIPATAVNSGNAGNENRRALDEAVRGHMKLLYMSPERLLQEMERIDISRFVSLFAIDEAHCISQWGHDFRPEYSELNILKERFPDIPAYIQYQWDGGASHVRLSGILRELSYRDLVAGSNRFATGWGVQLSTVMPKLIGGLGVFGHYTYGKGIASYVNDLADRQLDLVPDPDRSGRLRAQAVAGYTAGLQYQFTPSLLATASYSRAQVCDGASLGNDSYRYAQYVAVNAFYDVWNELRIGVEYLHGTRKDVGGMSGRANRLEAMLQYSF